MKKSKKMNKLTLVVVSSKIDREACPAPDQGEPLAGSRDRRGRRSSRRSKLLEYLATRGVQL